MSKYSIYRLLALVAVGALLLAACAQPTEAHPVEQPAAEEAAPTEEAEEEAMEEEEAAPAAEGRRAGSQR